MAPWLALACLAAAGALAGLALDEGRRRRQALARALGRRLEVGRGVAALRQAAGDAWEHTGRALAEGLPAALSAALAAKLEKAGGEDGGLDRLCARSLALAAGGWALGLGLGLGWGAAAFAALGCLPLVQLEDALKRRAKALRRALPDALDLLTACVQAGLGLEQALTRVVARLDAGPLKAEWQRALAGLRVGQSRREAFRAMEARVGLEEMGQLVSSLLQSEARGVPLAPALAAQAGQMRRLRALRVQKAAAEAPLKMLFPLMACILPVVFLVLFGPVLMQWSGLGL